MKTTFEQYDIIEIEWIDSFSSEQMWLDINSFDFDEHTTVSSAMRSVGFFLKKDNENIFYTSSINELTESCYGIMSIPIKAINKIRKLG